MYIAPAGSEDRVAFRLRSATETSDPSKTDQETMKACKDFEAVFLSMLWKEMSKSAGVDLGGWDIIGEQAMGRKWADSGGIGLAKVIYQQVAKYPTR